MTRLTRAMRHGEEGAAVTEMALMMIILIPTTLFTMFLSDAVFHLLDVQEAVLSATWDFTTRGYKSNKKDMGWHLHEVGNKTRLQYADHDSSFTNPKRINGSSFTDDGHMKHHTQPFGHVCWCNSPGNCPSENSPYTDRGSSSQVACKVHEISGAKFLDPIGASGEFLSAADGGMIECWGKGWLYNYLLRNQFLEEFSRGVKLFDRDHRTGDAHQSGASVKTDILLRYRAGLLVGTWAVSDGRKVDLGKSTPNKEYYQGVERAFKHMTWYGVAAAPTGIYMAKALSSQLALVGAAGNPLDLNMVSLTGNSTNAYKQDGLYTTPYYGESMTAFGKRGRYYMGSQKPETY